MIERFYLKDFLSFNEAELEFQKGLVVFSGPSGSGKSILMDAILSSFGLGSADAKVCESSVTWQLDEESGIENDDPNIFKQLKKEKTRYFINAQSVSKKIISSIAKRYLRHLSLKDFSDFENENLLDLLDKRIALHDTSIKETKEMFLKSYDELQSVSKKLANLKAKQQHITELKEFAAFEIAKIEEIDPKEGEYEELLTLKKQLSKKEKIQESLQNAEAIFELESSVIDALEMMDESSAFFEDAMNELRAKFERANELFLELEEVDVEELLNRLEALSDLKRKYGSISEALEYKAKKQKELEEYENIEFELEDLEKKEIELQTKVKELAKKLTELRKKELKNFQKELQKITNALYLDGVSVMLEPKELSRSGSDKVELLLHDTSLQRISTGEFNRLRLAILTLKSAFLEDEGGVLILDEIDANLSGEESMSVAKVLLELSCKYQIFVISHQPQLTSQGHQHFLVFKDNKGISHVQELQEDERVNEIARIISGESITKEAKEFAMKLRSDF